MANSGDNTVLFVNGKDQFIKTGKNKNLLTEENIDNLFRLYCDRKDVPYRAKVVPCDTIAANEYNLSVPTYVEAEPPPPPKPIEELNAEIDGIVKRQNVARAKIKELIAEISS